MGSNQRRKKQLIRQLLILFSVLFVAYIGFEALSAQLSSDKLLCGVFTDRTSTSPKVCMEIARSEGEKAKGLMFRKPGDLKADRAMIFVYPEESENSFWMKNTYIALDMIFLNSDFEIVGIVHNAEPLTLTPRKVSAKSRYVVEVLAGKSDEWGLKNGWKLKLDKPLT